MTRILALSLFALFALSAEARDLGERSVVFEPGTHSTQLQGSITGYETILYEVAAEAGQTLAIKLATSNLASYFNVYEPGTGPGEQALANAQITGPMVPEINQFEAQLKVSGTYGVSVYLMRSAARRNETSNFVLEISVIGDLPDVVQSDFADGLQGGPDFWKVTTVGGRLNLRLKPSAGAEIIGKLRPEAVLRNLGCRIWEGRRWCNVETLSEPPVNGWAAGNYLREAPQP